MAYNAQVKLGPELISNSREAWLGYYVFTLGAIAILGGGYWLVRRSGFEGADYWILLLGVAILAMVSLGVGVCCHLLGHLIDTVDELRLDGGKPGEKGTIDE